MAARTARIPFQPRSTNIFGSGNIDTSVTSKASSAAAAGSEVSATDAHNKARIMNSALQISSHGGNSIHRKGSNCSDTSTEATRSIHQPKPLTRSSSSSSRGGGSSSSRYPEENIVITEKRRKMNGDGYTEHQYLRGRMLGKGGFAKVYLCTAMDTNKQYAIKIVPKANLVKSRARQKLQTEIKIHRTLKHLHVCEYKHFFEDRNNCYILLELCHNQSMNELIKRRKRLTEPEAGYFMLHVVEAVEYMHAENVIHRDLKLGNLFLDKNLHIKVGDLGLATRLESAEEKRKTICGTPNYIAPEVIQGTKETRGHSFEVDIWSMGVILFTVLVGKPPYEAKDVKATYQRIIANEYAFPDHIPISDYAKDLIISMLQSDPKDRPSLLEIKTHPFFKSERSLIPKRLPNKILHSSPVWGKDESGELVVVNSANDENSAPTGRNKCNSKHSRSSASSSNRRFPLSTRDPNSGKGDRRDGPPKQERGYSSSSSSSRSATPAFDIYVDGTDNKSEATPSTRLKVLPDIADVEERVAAMMLRDKKAATKSAVSDADVLIGMVQRLDVVLEVAEETKYKYTSTGSSTKPCDSGGPRVWVTRYVDYTSKYGLGFLLNDGNSGVYFNDSTKAVLEGGDDGKKFQYVERRKVDTRDGPRMEPICETHTLTDYPDSLTKKVTLLQHFRNYLMEQQKKADDDAVPSGDDESSDCEMVYLKKWVRTKHAILFRLSNQTVQIVFHDQTEVLLTPDERYVTYVDKKRVRSTYVLSDAVVVSNSELAKRLKYTKEILLQMASGTSKASAK